MEAWSHITVWSPLLCFYYVRKRGWVEGMHELISYSVPSRIHDLYF